MWIAKNYQNRPILHKVIQKITVASFFLRHGVQNNFSHQLAHYRIASKLPQVKMPFRHVRSMVPV